MKKGIKKTMPKSRTATRRKSTSGNEHLILFRRVLLITTCMTLFVFLAADVSKKGVTQSVAGISVAKGLFAQATLTLPRITSAASYNIYYKEVADGHYIHAVRKIPAEATTYLVSYLKKNKKYHYKISAVDNNGKEFWWSKETVLTNTLSM
jgi:fibronectin type 3 domain-containing protein